MTYIIQFDGDLPHKRGLEAPEAYVTFEEVLARLRKLFIETRKPRGFGRGPWLPDEEDDRVLVWQVDPRANPTMKVVWAFVGSHWPRDNFPGLAQAQDELPGVGSLSRLAYA